MSETDTIEFAKVVESPPASAKLAAEMFATASAKYSRSGTAQAAKISLLCREKEQDPIELRKLLLKDKVQKEHLTAMAQNAHRHVVDHPDISSDPFMFEAQLKHVITEGFTLAARMNILTDQELSNILAQYPETKAEENAYADSVAIMLEQREATLRPPRKSKPWQRIKR